MVQRRREERWGEHRQQQSQVQQNVSCDKSKRKNKGVVLVIDRLINKQTKHGSSKEKRDRKMKGQASFRIFIGLKSYENNLELFKSSDVTAWVIHIETKPEERRVFKTQFYASPVL